MRHLHRSSRILLLLVGLVACSEDETPAPDAAAGELPFLAVCGSNEECATGLCFNFNARGLHCTHACESGAECAAPSPGCNNMNVCKAP